MDLRIYEPPPPRFLVWLGRTILTLWGWKVEAPLPDLPKYVLIFAPHTSNWDALFGVSAAMVKGIRPVITVKSQAFKGPWGGLFRYLGAFPIERSAHHGYVEQTIELFNKMDRLVFAVTPEGTRSYTDYWRSGFWHIAHGARVPIVLGWMDYKHKVVRTSPQLISTTDDIHADMARIAAILEGGMANGVVNAKYPDQVGPVRVRPEALGERPA